VINLGSFLDLTYSIRANKYLHVSQFNIAADSTSETDLYPDVVQLQAVYGIDDDNNSIVDKWEAASPTTPAGWQKVRAVRIALVARSQSRESEMVTLDGSKTDSTCESATPHPAAVCWKPDPEGDGVKIDVSVNNTDWQNYRYRVLETTVPLRNVIWQQ
jgi:type IV pilus assembly protein PilW